ncbi:3-deoxy-D-manno-octulosonic acid transferase [Antarcticimicrobium luteum]|uniref:3-deoxy-D-manno-octulosonic acid transferase n=1 Tax=Antarcticimicrobium luteum TaxID=2547397 RepID=A0A4R5UV10_9RHOB|nr:3-deoxy-D-manno-octulosonic acid transferase [Antarcticimicrobium luteum]TDK43068.1 3-deoxy-D-manno-octulosonic acid transferase [Antarcticimicrobium luteum]
MTPPTALFRLYRAITPLIQPLVWRAVARKLRAHGVDKHRQRERLGHASLPRPHGPLIWFHAASVGESLSVLTLIARLGARLPAANFLITSGTATSAELIEKRMPPRCRHQFAPLDAPGPVRRFLDHWRPDAALFVESEIWPLMIVTASDRGVPLALLNARLSEKSVAGWKKWPDTARFILGRFTLLMAQTGQTAEDLIAMGAPADRIEVGVNLKTTSAPPPVDSAALEAMRATVGARPLWLASSTHAGEEVIVLDAYRRVQARYPDLLLLLTPRHPERGAEVAGLIAAARLSCARRSAGETPGPDTRVYLADTLGETGTWYSLAPFAFLGASLVDKGGHNPIEPAQFGVPLITGPFRQNARAAYAALQASGGLVEVHDAATLAAAVTDWLDHPARLSAAQSGARSLSRRQDAALERVVERLCDALTLGANGDRDDA